MRKQREQPESRSLFVKLFCYQNMKYSSEKMVCASSL